MMLALAYMLMNMVQCSSLVASHPRGGEITQTVTFGHRDEKGKRIHYCAVTLGGTDAKVKRVEMLRTEGEGDQRIVVSSKAGEVRYSNDDERTFEVDIPLDENIIRTGISLRFCFDDPSQKDFNSKKSWVYNKQAKVFYRCYNFGHSAPDQADD